MSLIAAHWQGSILRLHFIRWSTNHLYFIWLWSDSLTVTKSLIKFVGERIKVCRISIIRLVLDSDRGVTTCRWISNENRYGLLFQYKSPQHFSLDNRVEWSATVNLFVRLRKIPMLAYCQHRNWRAKLATSSIMWVVRRDQTPDCIITKLHCLN